MNPRKKTFFHAMNMIFMAAAVLFAFAIGGCSDSNTVNNNLGDTGKKPIYGSLKFPVSIASEKTEAPHWTEIFTFTGYSEGVQVYGPADFTLTDIDKEGFITLKNVPAGDITMTGFCRNASGLILADIAPVTAEVIENDTTVIDAADVNFREADEFAQHVLSFTVTPEISTVLIGESIQLTAVLETDEILDLDGEPVKQNITSSATWQASTEFLKHEPEPGLYTGKYVGTTTITVSVGNMEGISTSKATVNVSDGKIDVPTGDAIFTLPKDNCPEGSVFFNIMFYDEKEEKLYDGNNPYTIYFAEGETSMEFTVPGIPVTTAYAVVTYLDENSEVINDVAVEMTVTEGETTEVTIPAIEEDEEK